MSINKQLMNVQNCFAREKVTSDFSSQISGAKV